MDDGDLRMGDPSGGPQPDRNDGGPWTADHDPGWVADRLDDWATTAARIPDAPGRLLDVLSRVLAGPVDDRTYGQVDDAIRILFGESSAELVEWMMQSLPERLKLVEALDERGSLASLKPALAAYSSELLRAYDLATQLADEWKTVTHSAFYDNIGERFVLRATIHKNDGTSFVIETSPNGMLDLVRGLMRPARAVGRRDVFGDTTVAAYLAEADPLRALLVPDEPSDNAWGGGVVDADGPATS